MAVSLHELIQPQIILKVISRIKTHQSRLSKWLGFQPTRFDPDKPTISGPNTVESYGRQGTYRIYDNTRTIATFKSPGSGPAVTFQQPVGSVQYTYARVHEKMILDYESLGNLSPLVGPNAQIDANGENYIARQLKTLGQRMNNAVSAMAAGLMRGGFYLVMVGDRWEIRFSAPSAGTAYNYINYRVPAGNLAQLNMLGTGNIIDVTWLNAAATIVKHLMSIKSAQVQLSGYMVEHAWITSLMWYNLISNTEVRNTAGTAATPYAEYDYVEETDMEGGKVSEFAAILKADPTITWHISDEGLVFGPGVGDPVTSSGAGTFTKIIPDTNAWFLPTADSDWVQMGYGSEPVVEYQGPTAGVQRSGYYAWHKYVDQPSGVELLSLLNCLPFLYIPNVLVNGTVVF